MARPRHKIPEHVAPNGVRSTLPPGYVVGERFPPGPPAPVRSTMGQVPQYGVVGNSAFSGYLHGPQPNKKPPTHAETMESFAELDGLRALWWAEVLSCEPIAEHVVRFAGGEDGVPKAVVKALGRKRFSSALVVEWLRGCRGQARSVWKGIQAQMRGEPIKWIPGQALRSTDRPWFDRCERAMAECTRVCARIAGANVRLAMRRAARFTGRGGFSYHDLIHEAFMGLIVAAERFDPDRGLHFSTYSLHWVRHHINRAIENGGRIVRVPVGMQLRRLAVQNARDKVGNDPAAIMAETGCSERQIRLLYQQAGFMSPHVSMDTHRDPDGRALGGILPDGAQLPDESIVEAERLAAIRTGVEALDDRDREILRRRFGFDDEPETLAEIARTLGLSRERVRQLEARSLEGLRSLMSEKRGALKGKMDRILEFFEKAEAPALLSEVATGARVAPSDARAMLKDLFARGRLRRVRYSRYSGPLGVSDVELMVLDALAREPAQAGGVVVIKKATGLHPRAVKGALRRLEECGRLEREKRSYSLPRMEEAS